MRNTRLKTMRKVTGYRQAQLARMVNVAQSTYSDWETGRKNIHAENIKKLAEIYDVSLDFLSGRDFYLSKPVESWTGEQQQEYYTSNEYKKTYLEYLWGAPIFSDDATVSTKERKILATANTVSTLSEHEARMLAAYRSLPHMQAAVDKILGIDESGEYALYAAAKSDDNHPPRILHKMQKDWDAIANAPETDEPLI